MTKNSIIHFVGFITRLEQSLFVDQWSYYAKEFASGNDTFVLQQTNESRGKYRYVSQHEFGEQNFRFSFMKNRDSENFPDQKARVVMFGGYMPLEIGSDDIAERKILAFFSSDRIDLDTYRQLALPGRLNIYQPFYENCLYGYILEFFTKDRDVERLEEELSKRNEASEIAVYSECQTPYSVY